MREQDLTQSSLAAKSTVTQTQISRYLNTDALPEPAKLELLCQAIGKDGRKLLAAYLRDCIPPKLQGLVAISTVATNGAAGGEHSAQPSVYLELTAHQRKVVDQIAELILKRPKALAAFESTLDLIT